MPLALILMAHGYAAPNPTMVGQQTRASARDPAPGILKIARRPIMWGIALWGDRAQFSFADCDWTRLLIALVAFGVLLFLREWLTGAPARPD